MRNLLVSKYCFTINFLLVLLLGLSSTGSAETKTWDRGDNSDNWKDGKNWNPNGVPKKNDDVVIPSEYTVVLNEDMPEILKSLTIESGSTLTTTTDRRQSAQTITINGTYQNGSTRDIEFTTMSVNSGGAYIHLINGGTIPNATWHSNSNCIVRRITDTGPSGLNQTFGNFTWDCSGQGTNNIVSTPGNIIVSGNFTLSDGIFALSNSTTQQRTLTISGNYIQTGGVFDFNSEANGSLSTVYIAGNISNSSSNESIITNGGGAINGQMIFNGSSTQTINFTNSNAAQWVTFTVNNGSSLELSSNITLTGDNSEQKYYADFVINGSIDFKNFIVNDASYNNVSDASHFTLNSGATLITANQNGISLSGNTGSVQITGPRAYNAGGNYIYKGSSAQIIGNGLTGANNLTINNIAGVTLSGAVSVSGALTLTNGTLTTSDTNLLSVTNNATSTISGGSATSFINGPVKWTLATGQSYTFPIGKGTTYLPFGIIASAGTSPQINAEAFSGNTGGAATSPLGSLSTTEYWLASVAGGTYTNGSVSLTRQSALSGLDAIGRSATLAGAYSTLNGTVSGTSINNSDNTGNTLGYFVMAAKRSIATGTISPTTYCQGATVSIPFTITGTYTLGNVFTAQLSNASGSFASPVNIGTLNSTAAGTISAIIPAGTLAGTGYRIRVISNTPAVTGSDNGTNLTINAVPSSPTVGTITQPTCSEATGSVVLNGLPTGNWTLTRNPGGIKTTGTGTSATISGLVTGTYTYTVTNEDNNTSYPGSGTGLNAEYFNNMTLAGTPALSRNDATVNFNWADGSPGSLIGNDNFSVRWTGRVQPQYSENYTFTTRSDDGIRLWVNGTQIINNWTDHAATDNTGTISLVAGQKCDLVLEFYENGGQAVAQLSWTSASQLKQIIPQTQLYFEATGCTSSASGNVVINAVPVNMTTSTASSTPTLCINTALTNITHATTGATGIGSPTNLPAGVTAAFASNTITISGTPTASGTFNYSIPLTGGCGTVNATGTITVTPANTAGTASSNPTLCINTALTAITRTTTGATGIGTATGLPAGVTAAFASNTITIGGTPTASGVFAYTISLTGGCGTVNATGTIIVTDIPTATISYAGTPFCTSVATAQTVTLSGTGAYTGGTYSSTAGLSLNTSTGAITPGTSTAGTYTVTYTIPATGGCASVPVTTSVTITTLPVATFSYAGTPYCSNVPNPLPTFNGGGVAGTFSSTAGLNFVSTATGEVNLATSTAGTYTVTNTIGAAGNCPQVSATSLVTIAPLVHTNVITQP